MQKNMTFSGPARIFFGLGLAIMIGYVVYIGRGVLIPFVIAAFLCFLIFTLKESVSKVPGIGKHLPHWLCYLCAFAIIIAAFIGFSAIISANVGNVLKDWPNYETRLTNLAQDLFAYMRTLEVIPPEFIGSVADIQQAALGMVRPLLSQAIGTLGAITSNFLTLGTVIFYMAFMLIERGRIFKKINYLSDNEFQQTAISETISDVATLVRQYITVKTVTNLITAIVSYIIMLVIGVDYAGFWALVIFIFNYIPLFGAALAILMPVSLMLVQPDGGVLKAATLLGLMLGAEQTMSSMIEPRLVGKTLNLSPLVILFSLAIWGSLWGFTGVLLSIPMTITVMIILTQFKATRPIAIMLSDNGIIADIKATTLMAAHQDKTKKQDPDTKSHDIKEHDTQDISEKEGTQVEKVKLSQTEPSENETSKEVTPPSSNGPKAT